MAEAKRVEGEAPSGRSGWAHRQHRLLKPPSGFHGTTATSGTNCEVLHLGSRGLRDALGLRGPDGSDTELDLLLYMYSNRMPRRPLLDEDRRHGRLVGAMLARAKSTDGRSAQQLAEAASLSVDTVRSLVSGRVPTPTFLTVARVAAVLGVSLDELHAEASRPGPADTESARRG